MTEDELRSAIEGIKAPSAQRANVLALIAEGDWQALPSDVATNAYDGGVSLHWPEYEIAVFDDRYETYQFTKSDTQIHHWPHSPGDPLDAGMRLEIRHATGSNAG